MLPLYLVTSCIIQTFNIVTMRLKLRYKYCLQFVNGEMEYPVSFVMQEKPIHCSTLCSCPKIEEFMNPNISDVTMQACHMINNNVVPSILKTTNYSLNGYDLLIVKHYVRLYRSAGRAYQHGDCLLSCIIVRQ